MKAECKVDWCDRPVKGLGYCSGHHQRLTNGVDMDKPWRTGSGMKCSASSTCKRTGRPRNRGMCYLHYQAFRRQRKDWSGFMPASEVNAHIEMLLSTGVSLQRIALISGLSKAGVRLIRKRQRVWRTNGEKILAITPEGFQQSEESGFVPVIGSARRLRALIAFGYSQRELAERLGLTETWIYQVLSDRTRYVCMSTAQGIDALFRELQLQTPPSSRVATASRNRAVRKGWLPPFAWDEDEIDDPEAKAHELRRPKDRIDWIAEHQELKDMGLTDGQIAERWGVTRDGAKCRLRRQRDRLEAA